MSCVCDDNDDDDDDDDDGLISSRFIRDQEAVLYVSKAVQGQTSNSVSGLPKGKAVKTTEPQLIPNTITINRLLWLLSAKRLFVVTK